MFNGGTLVWLAQIVERIFFDPSSFLVDRFACGSPSNSHFQSSSDGTGEITRKRIRIARKLILTWHDSRHRWEAHIKILECSHFWIEIVKWPTTYWLEYALFLEKMAQAPVVVHKTRFIAKYIRPSCTPILLLETEWKLT